MTTDCGNDERQRSRHFEGRQCFLEPSRQAAPFARPVVSCHFISASNAFSPPAHNCSRPFRLDNSWPTISDCPPLHCTGLPISQGHTLRRLLLAASLTGTPSPWLERPTPPEMGRLSSHCCWPANCSNGRPSSAHFRRRQPIADCLPRPDDWAAPQLGLSLGPCSILALKLGPPEEADSRPLSRPLGPISLGIIGVKLCSFWGSSLGSILGLELGASSRGKRKTNAPRTPSCSAPVTVGLTGQLSSCSSTCERPPHTLSHSTVQHRPSCRLAHSHDHCGRPQVSAWTPPAAPPRQPLLAPPSSPPGAEERICRRMQTAHFRPQLGAQTVGATLLTSCPHAARPTGSLAPLSCRPFSQFRSD